MAAAIAATTAATWSSRLRKWPDDRARAEGAGVAGASAPSGCAGFWAWVSALIVALAPDGRALLIAILGGWR
jgi:hypothetical protein